VRAGRKYPWGDREPDCDDANFNECDVGYPRATRPVGTRMNGVGAQPAWLEVYDLAGNLQELTVDNADSLAGECWTNPAAGRFSMRDPLCVPPRPSAGEPQQPHRPVLRGGSLRHPEPGIRTAARDGSGSTRTQPDRDVGFRCVRLR
jgi:formylglycine-generating enzyme required for sulfatase activity